MLKVAEAKDEKSKVMGMSSSECEEIRREGLDKKQRWLIN